jgi:protein-tyrosine phosphatase
MTNTYYDEIMEIPNAYDCVGNNLFIGGILPSYRQFDYVVCCTPEETHYARINQVTHMVPFNDCRELPSEQFLTEIVALVRDCRVRGSTYVHCSAGVNRSAMIVALVLIADGYEPQEAVNYLRELRSVSVLCNEDFYQRVLQG